MNFQRIITVIQLTSSHRNNTTPIQRDNINQSTTYVIQCIKFHGRRGINYSLLTSFNTVIQLTFNCITPINAHARFLKKMKGHTNTTFRTVFQYNTKQYESMHRTLERVYTVVVTTWPLTSMAHKIKPTHSPTNVQNINA